MLVLALAVVVSALVISQQRRLMISLIRKLENMPILRRFDLSQSYGTIQVLLAPKIYAKSAAYSVVAWIIESIAVYFIFSGFGIDISFMMVVLIFTTSSIIGAASMLPGGIGLTEGGMVSLLYLQGIDYTTAFATVLLVRLVTLWYGVGMGLITLRMVSSQEKKNKVN